LVVQEFVVCSTWQQLDADLAFEKGEEIGSADVESMLVR